RSAGGAAELRAHAEPVVHVLGGVLGRADGAGAVLGAGLVGVAGRVAGADAVAGRVLGTERLGDHGGVTGPADVRAATGPGVPRVARAGARGVGLRVGDQRLGDAGRDEAGDRGGRDEDPRPARGVLPHLVQDVLRTARLEPFGHAV